MFLWKHSLERAFNLKMGKILDVKISRSTFFGRKG